MVGTFRMLEERRDEELYHRSCTARTGTGTSHAASRMANKGGGVVILGFAGQVARMQARSFPCRGWRGTSRNIAS